MVAGVIGAPRVTIVRVARDGSSISQYMPLLLLKGYTEVMSKFCVYWSTDYSDRHPSCEPYSCSDAGTCKQDTVALERMSTMNIGELSTHLAHENVTHRKAAVKRLVEICEIP